MSMFNDPINSDKHVREPGEHARPTLSHAREYFCVYPACSPIKSECYSTSILLYNMLKHFASLCITPGKYLQLQHFVIFPIFISLCKIFQVCKDIMLCNEDN